MNISIYLFAYLYLCLLAVFLGVESLGHWGFVGRFSAVAALWCYSPASSESGIQFLHNFSETGPGHRFTQGGAKVGLQLFTWKII